MSVFNFVETGKLIKNLEEGTNTSAYRQHSDLIILKFFLRKEIALRKCVTVANKHLRKEWNMFWKRHIKHRKHRLIYWSFLETDCNEIMKLLIYYKNLVNV
jgi:hypothetical protein